MESGKKLNQDLTEIVVTFKEKGPCLFCRPGLAGHYKNELIFRIQPKEGIIHSFFAKKPGPVMEVERKELHFFYQEAFVRERLLPDYERLLIDVFLGDQTLFVSTKEILETWRFIDPLLKAWKKNLIPLKIYPQNSTGPK